MTKLEMIVELGQVLDLTNEVGRGKVERVIVALQLEQDKDVREWLRAEELDKRRKES